MVSLEETFKYNEGPQLWFSKVTFQVEDQWVIRITMNYIKEISNLTIKAKPHLFLAKLLTQQVFKIRPSKRDSNPINGLK